MSDWSYRRIEIEQSEVQKRLLTPVLSADVSAALTDTISMSPFRIVSERMRVFLETEFSDAGQFYPFS
jgi:hypothetical protein|tara:strand:- start:231 stop:434 length:204 start_codon:yes stop_codon:yes gene_type:complete